MKASSCGSLASLGRRTLKSLSESEYLLMEKFSIRNKVKLQQSSIGIIFNFIVVEIEARKKRLNPHLHEMIPSSMSLDRKFIDRFVTEIPAVKSISKSELSWIVKKLAQRAML